MTTLHDPQTPFLALDPGVVAANVRRLRARPYHDVLTPGTPTIDTTGPRIRGR